MIDQVADLPASKRPSPGDIIAVETEKGTRHIQVTHLRSPYPDVVRAIRPARDVESPEAIAQGATAFVAMVELGRALRDGAVSTKVVCHATIPAEHRQFPTFWLPIRNKAGDVVYWWTWDGGELKVAPETADGGVPLREIVPITTLRARLAELG